MKWLREGIRFSYVMVFTVVLLYVLLCAALIFRIRSSAEETVTAGKRAGELVSKSASLERKIKDVRRLDRIRSALVFLGNRKLDSLEVRSITANLWTLSRRYAFDPLLVLALVSVESRGNPSALGRFRSGKLSGALGLMQIKSETARIVARGLGIHFSGKNELFRPGVNLVLGTAYLMQLIQRYGSLRYGIMAYNIGPGAMDLALRGKQPLPGRYYNRVLSNYYGLVRRFGPEYLSGKAG